jgi:hypothetical protein
MRGGLPKMTPGLTIGIPSDSRYPRFFRKYRITAATKIAKVATNISKAAITNVFLQLTLSVSFHPTLFKQCHFNQVKRITAPSISIDY